MDFDKNKLYHSEIFYPNSNYDIRFLKKYTMLDKQRIFNLIDKCKEVNKKLNNGIAIECGVAKGGSLQIMKKYLNHQFVIYGFDSFSNMPPLTEKDENEKRALNHNFTMKNNKLIGNVFGSEKICLNGFKKNNISLENVHLVKGFFQDSIPKYLNNLNNIVLLRLDSDWYESTYYVLEQLYPKVVKGGIILIDDFYAYIGCRKAVIEYFNNHNLNLPKLYHTFEENRNTLTGGTEVFFYKE